MLELNYANMMNQVIGKNGIAEEELANLRTVIEDVHGAISRRKYPGLDFLDLPDQDVSEIKSIAAQIREESEAFLLLGIGGSALGPRAVLEALRPFHNLSGTPKVFIYDNVDPRTLDAILSLVDLEKTTVNVISKSGNTAETAASFMILWNRIQERFGSEAAKRFVATTDPVSGNLRKFAEDHGMRTLPIGKGIGGRYSVLSAVGLLTAEVIGMDSSELLAGAAAMRTKCASADLQQNPAYMLGTLLHLMNKNAKRNVNALIPYADSLKSLSEWFCQLWAESLGKQGKGMTPYPSVGTTDQHSQVQLWMQGPDDKVIMFIRPDAYTPDYVIPSGFEEIDGISYLSGHSLSELIKAEEESTELALAKNGHPNMTITISAIDAHHLGQLFMLFEIATAFTGILMGIDPFDQPGVEESKNYTYGMMGKKGFDEKAAEVNAAREKKRGWKVS